MVEFKAVISDKSKSYQVPIAGDNAGQLINRKIGDEVDGRYVNLPGYKLKITGGTDKDGFPMRRDLTGQRRKKVLITKEVGFKPKHEGVRKKRSIRGNTISQEISQINFKILSHGPKKLEELLKIEKKEKAWKSKNSQK